jgi:hypothetical protein
VLLAKTAYTQQQPERAVNGFLLLVVAGDPSYFNNYQRRLRAVVFCCRIEAHVAGWLWLILQADTVF